MNRTLLLIICDFLLLNLLALTRWENMEPVPTQKPPVPMLEANRTVAPNQDLVGAMKQALEMEQKTREQLQQRLQAAEASDAAQRQSVEQLQTQRSQLATNLAQVRKKTEELARLFDAASGRAAAAQARAGELEHSLEARNAELERQRQLLKARAEADLLREQMEQQLRQALEEKQAEIDRQRDAFIDAQEERNAALREATRFAAAVRVAEAERDHLRKDVTHLKGEVDIAREEKVKLHEHARELAGGVTSLAARTGELTDEIRHNVPVNMNLMFNDFLSNRVEVSVSALGQGLFGSKLRTEVCQTVLVRDGTNLFAPLHVSETPFVPAIPATGMSIASASVTRTGHELTKGPLLFYSADPRVVMAPVPLEAGMSSGVKIYDRARNPFKFTEAVLISRGGRYYGEVEFKLDARTPDYVRMKHRLFSGLFGEFSPSKGDLVLSKTGEFLGIMVNSDYCAVLQAFSSQPGDRFDERTLASTMRFKLEEFKSRIDTLPVSLR